METLFVALRVLLSLAAVLGLLWWLQRRLSRGPRAARENPVTVVTRQSLTPKASVVVIEVDGRRLVLGVTEHSIAVLQTADAVASAQPDAATVGTTAGPASVFAASLDAATAAAPAAPTLVPPLAATALVATPLAGSILSPTTWKQAAATLRRVR